MQEMAKLLEDKELKLNITQGKLKAAVGENKELKKRKKEDTEEKTVMKKEMKSKDGVILEKEMCITSLQEKLVLLHATEINLRSKIKTLEKVAEDTIKTDISTSIDDRNVSTKVAKEREVDITETNRQLCGSSQLPSRGFLLLLIGVCHLNYPPRLSFHFHGS